MHQLQRPQLGDESGRAGHIWSAACYLRHRSDSWCAPLGDLRRAFTPTT